MGDAITGEPTADGSKAVGVASTINTGKNFNMAIEDAYKIAQSKLDAANPTVPAKPTETVKETITSSSSIISEPITATQTQEITGVAPQTAELSAEDITTLSPEDLKIKLEKNEFVKKVGEGAYVFINPKDGAYMIVNLKAIPGERSVEIREDSFGSLEKIIKTRGNENDAEIDPVIKNRRKMLEKVEINPTTKQLEVTLLGGDKDNPITTIHTAQLVELNEKFIPEILELNKAKSPVATAPTV